MLFTVVAMIFHLASRQHNEPEYQKIVSTDKAAEMVESFRRCYAAASGTEYTCLASLYSSQVIRSECHISICHPKGKCIDEGTVSANKLETPKEAAPYSQVKKYRCDKINGMNLKSRAHSIQS